MILNSITSAKSLLPQKATFMGSGNQDMDILGSSPHWDRVTVRRGARRQRGWSGGSRGGKVAACEAREVEAGTEHVEEALSLLLAVIKGVIKAGCLFFFFLKMQLFILEGER